MSKQSLNTSYNLVRRRRQQARYLDFTGPALIRIFDAETNTIKTSHGFKTYGADRRKFIIDMMKKNPRGQIIVNRRYCPILKYDIDLAYLVKKGILKQIRIHRGFGGRQRLTALVGGENI